MMHAFRNEVPEIMNIVSVPVSSSYRRLKGRLFFSETGCIVFTVFYLLLCVYMYVCRAE